MDAADGRTFETLDPSTGRPIAEVAQAGAEDVDRAVRAARAAFEDGRWSGVSAAERTRALLAFAEAIEAHADELAELESLDNGKPVKLAKRVDVALAAEHLRYFAGWPTRIAGDVLPVAQRDMHCYTRKEPVGVCGRSPPGTSRCCCRRGSSARHSPPAAPWCSSPPSRRRSPPFGWPSWLSRPACPPAC